MNVTLQGVAGAPNGALTGVPPGFSSSPTSVLQAARTRLSPTSEQSLAVRLSLGACTYPA